MASEAYHDWSCEATDAQLRVNFTLKLLLSQNFCNQPLMRFISFASNIGPAAAVPVGPAPAPLNMVFLFFFRTSNTKRDREHCSTLSEMVVMSNRICFSVLLFLSFVHSFHRHRHKRVSFGIILGTAAFLASLTASCVGLGCYHHKRPQPGSRYHWAGQHVLYHSQLSWIQNRRPNHLGQACQISAE